MLSHSDEVQRQNGKELPGLAGFGDINIPAIMCDVTTRLWRVKRPATDGWLQDRHFGSRKKTIVRDAARRERAFGKHAVELRNFCAIRAKRRLVRLSVEYVATIDIRQLHVYLFENEFEAWDS